MLSNFFSRINQKWNEFLYGPVCSWLNEMLFEDGHIVIESNKPKEHQNTNEYIGTSLSEIVTKFREQPIKWLESIDYSPEKFAEFIPLKTKRDEIIKHYEEEALPKLIGNEAEKMKGFINNGWKIVAHEDCLLPDEALDMSAYEIVDHDDRPLPNKELDMNKGEVTKNEQPGTNIRTEGKSILSLFKRFLG